MVFCPPSGFSLPVVNRVGSLVRALRRAYNKTDSPAKAMPDKDPFRILVSAALSTRTQDSVTAQAVSRLFQHLGRSGSSPDASALAQLGPKTIERLIYPVGFYHTKARVLQKLGQEVSRLGRVPNTLEGLLRLPGVGRKVANIVLSRGFGIPAIAADTHVHRISNRLGLVRTTRPERTEEALVHVLPKRYWIEWNYLLVSLGQTICRPQNPRCDVCPVRRCCGRVGATD